MDNFHRSATKDVGRAYDERIAEAQRDLLRFGGRVGRAVLGLTQAQLRQQSLKPLPVFRQIYRIGGGSKDRDFGPFQGRRKLKGSLPAELNDNTHQRPGPLLDPDDLDYILGGQWLEIQ